MPQLVSPTPRLHAACPVVASQLMRGHETAVCTGQTQALVQAVEQVVAGGGGRLAAGYRRG